VKNGIEVLQRVPKRFCCSCFKVDVCNLEVDSLIGRCVIVVFRVDHTDVIVIFTGLVSYFILNCTIDISTYMGNALHSSMPY